MLGANPLGTTVPAEIWSGFVLPSPVPGGGGGETDLLAQPPADVVPERVTATCAVAFGPPAIRAQAVLRLVAESADVTMAAWADPTWRELEIELEEDEALLALMGALEP